MTPNDKKYTKHLEKYNAHVAEALADIIQLIVGYPDGVVLATKTITRLSATGNLQALYPCSGEDGRINGATVSTEQGATSLESRSITELLVILDLLESNELVVEEFSQSDQHEQAIYCHSLADHWAVLLEKEQPVFYRLTSPARDLHIQLMIDLVKKRSGLSIQIAEYQQSCTLYEVSLLPSEVGPPPPAAKLFRTPGIWRNQVIPQNFDELPIC